MQKLLVPSKEYRLPTFCFLEGGPEKNMEDGGVLILDGTSRHATAMQMLSWDLRNFVRYLTARSFPPMMLIVFLHVSDQDSIAPVDKHNILTLLQNTVLFLLNQ